MIFWDQFWKNYNSIFGNFLDSDDRMLVYALICNTFDVEIISKIRRLFELLKSYKNCFNFKNAKFKFFEHTNENHVINLILDVKSSYELLYVLFKTELNVLKNYLLKNLILSCIQEFTSRANASMLFVFKKTIIFDFVLIIKNWMLWSSRINVRFH